MSRWLSPYQLLPLTTMVADRAKAVVDLKLSGVWEAGEEAGHCQRYP
jgi:hypothetical protein